MEVRSITISPETFTEILKNIKKDREYADNFSMVVARSNIPTETFMDTVMEHIMQLFFFWIGYEAVWTKDDPKVNNFVDQVYNYVFNYSGTDIKDENKVINDLYNEYGALNLYLRGLDGNVEQ